MGQVSPTILELLNRDVEIFNFDYPFYDESKRKHFEELFINHFMFDEIGSLPIARWQQRLKSKLNLLMPTINKNLEASNLEIRILDNYEVVESYNSSTKSDGENTSILSSNGTNRALFKETPMTKVDIDNFDTVTSLNKDINENTSNGNNTTKSNVENNWERKMSGNIGVQTDIDAVSEFYDKNRNVINELFDKELSKLFLGVYVDVI